MIMYDRSKEGHRRWRLMLTVILLAESVPTVEQVYICPPRCARTSILADGIRNPLECLVCRMHLLSTAILYLVSVRASSESPTGRSHTPECRPPIRGQWGDRSLCQVPQACVILL